MQQLNALIDSLVGDLPVATISFIAGVTLLIIAYANGTVSLDDAFKDLVYLGGAAGGIGYVRNGANKGVRTTVKK
jgi:hypothetical protein